MFKPRPVFGSNVSELYPIANLEIARHDNAAGAHHYIIDPQHNFQLGSYLQLHVTTVDQPVGPWMRHSQVNTAQWWNRVSN